MVVALEFFFYGIVQFGNGKEPHVADRCQNPCRYFADTALYISLVPGFVDTRRHNDSIIVLSHLLVISLDLR